MAIMRQLKGMSTWTRVLIIFAFLWGVLVLIFASKLNTTGNQSSLQIDAEYTKRRLNQAIDYLEQSRKQNAELKQLIDVYINDNNLHSDDKEKLINEIESKLQHQTNDVVGNSATGRNNFIINNGMTPTNEYEQLRRRIRTNVHEMWNFANNEFEKIRKKVIPLVPELGEDINRAMSFLVENKWSLVNDMDRLRTIDGYDQWRDHEARNLSDLVQRRLHYLQNPKDCNKARKLVCRLNKGCGFGCQLHHLVYCFIMAYGTERTLILKSKGWRYHKGGWDEVFKPLSETCSSTEGTSHANFGNAHYNTQIVDLPIIDSLMMNPRPAYLPLAIPEDLAPRLTRIHGDPIVWWVGQFMKYLLRMQPETQAMIDAGIEKLGFKGPIVGVHVRRTDKVGTEAALHPVDEYMKWVDEYYNQREMIEKIDQRRIFLASDDPKVIDEARKKYPNYEVIGDPNVARMAALSTRYTDSSLNGIILDIYLLSRSDYLVCTFSSQVCRVAYEIMQSLHTDASHRFKSLDDVFYFGGQNAHNRQAVLPHHPRTTDEIFMNGGDLIGLAGNHWNGFSKGRNTRTNQNGLFPSFKVIDKVETADFPKYPNVK